MLFSDLVVLMLVYFIPALAPAVTDELWKTESVVLLRSGTGTFTSCSWGTPERCFLEISPLLAVIYLRSFSGSMWNSTLRQLWIFLVTLSLLRVNECWCKHRERFCSEPPAERMFIHSDFNQNAVLKKMEDKHRILWNKNTFLHSFKLRCGSSLLKLLRHFC